MAASPHHTHMQTPPHRVRSGTRTDMVATLLWDRMAPMGRTQHSCPPTRSYMGNKIRTRALMEQEAQLVLFPVRGGWGYTTTRLSEVMSMMDMVESDEDSGLHSVAEREPGSPTMPSPLIPPMAPCCSSLSFIIHVHYRHLLITIHVNDCFTTSLTLVFAVPLIPPNRISHARSASVPSLSFDPWIETVACRSFLFVLLPPSPSISPSYRLLWHRIFTGILLSCSCCSLPLATARYCTYFRLAGTHGC